MLTILSDAGDKKYPSGGTVSTVLCLCDCGKEKIIAIPNLLYGGIGGTKSCGCLRPENVFGKINAGKVFGILRTIRRVGKDKWGNAIWETECILCGRKREVLLISLKNGDSNSCGCSYSNESFIAAKLKEYAQANGTFIEIDLRENHSAEEWIEYIETFMGE